MYYNAFTPSYLNTLEKSEKKGFFKEKYFKNELFIFIINENY